MALNDADFVDNDNFSDLVEDPTNLNRLYAANSAGGPGGIYRSDDLLFDPGVDTLLAAVAISDEDDRSWLF